MIGRGLFFIFRVISYPAHRAFLEALKSPQDAQSNVLKQIILANSKTKYGQEIGLLRADTYREFAQKVPISTYEQLEPWLKAQMNSNDRMISPEKPSFFEKTSGSSGKSKYIPYPPALRRSFSKLFFIWAHDLLSSRIGFRGGRIFMSVSPVFLDERKTANGTPIGVEDDSSFAGKWTQLLLRRFLVLPKGLNRIQDPFRYRFTLALALLTARDLESISIWNPTYLESILTFISEHRSFLLDAYRAGQIDSDHVSMKWKPRMSVENELARTPENLIRWERIWPNLKFLSAWADGPAAPFADRLRKSLSRNRLSFQAKGLLATEAPLTIPLTKAFGSVPFVTEVFFEFIDKNDDIVLIGDLIKGEEYEVLVTQKGGLLRYRIGDRVLVTQMWGNVPILKFVGRTQSVSDLVGEKLNASFVEDCFDEIFGLRPPGGFAFLYPDPISQPPRYRLVMNDSANEPEKSAQDLEDHLMTATHYRLARLLGQLAPVQLERSTNPEAEYSQAFERLGLKWGDIKHQRLVTRADFILNFRSDRDDRPERPAPAGQEASISLS